MSSQEFSSFGSRNTSNRLCGHVGHPSWRQAVQGWRWRLSQPAMLKDERQRRAQCSGSKPHVCPRPAPWLADRHASLTSTLKAFGLFFGTLKRMAAV